MTRVILDLPPVAFRWRCECECFQDIMFGHWICWQFWKTQISEFVSCCFVYGPVATRWCCLNLGDTVTYPQCQLVFLAALLVVYKYASLSGYLWSMCSSSCGGNTVMSESQQSKSYCIAAWAQRFLSVGSAVVMWLWTDLKCTHGLPHMFSNWSEEAPREQTNVR